MSPSRARVGALAVVAVVALAGCGQLLGGTESAATDETLTPAPVPSVSTASPTATATPAPTWTPSSRYELLRPTCTRPPGVVIHIQVSALANNDPMTDDGIETTWRFAAPSNKEYTGPYDTFVDIIRSSYRPLLEAERITYGPLERGNGTASRRVTVASNDTATTYRWQLQKVTTAPYDGCWMTSGVAAVSTEPATERPSGTPTETAS